MPMPRTTPGVDLSRPIRSLTPFTNSSIHYPCRRKASEAYDKCFPPIYPYSSTKSGHGKSLGPGLGLLVERAKPKASSFCEVHTLTSQLSVKRFISHSELLLLEKKYFPRIPGTFIVTAVFAVPRSWLQQRGASVAAPGRVTTLTMVNVEGHAKVEFASFAIT